jgi:hypothetical protein
MVMNMSQDKWKNRIHRHGKEKKNHREGRGAQLIGVTLVVIGLWFIVGPSFWRDFWPITLVIAGAWIIISAVTRRRPALDLNKEDE